MNESLGLFCQSVFTSVSPLLSLRPFKVKLKSAILTSAPTIAFPHDLSPASSPDFSATLFILLDQPMWDDITPMHAQEFSPLSTQALCWKVKKTVNRDVLLFFCRRKTACLFQ